MATTKTAGEGGNAALIAEIKAQLMSELKEEMKAEVKAEMAAASEPQGPYKETEEELAKANELVSLKLFKDKDKYKDDVLVILNGDSWLIKRGEEVQVPRKVYDVLKCSDDQTGYAADIISGFEEDYKKKKDQLA
jgi:hypothetical protein